MDNFIVSARKYRPENFHSVVGQLSITKTLKNSISGNHLAHAYLFCGPRGVGKTTCARIFAKTVNCQNITEDHEACNNCESCNAFNDGCSYNIHELDAASNNSVEDIRTLIEQVRVPPQIGSHSIYIIDEVHMLSTAAFNAFLKTLEEPPPHAIFVLATTEKHKILPTILSRCQIFDFNRITVDDAAKHLAYVAEQEGIDADERALNAIALKADGAMRDALSFFDQIVSFSGKTITFQNAIDNLNILDYRYYFTLIDAFLKGDYQESLIIFNEILTKGFDAHHFITGLSSHIRDLLVVKTPKTIELFETGEAVKQKYLEQAQKCTPQFLFNALKITNTADLAYRTANNKRLLTEICLLELANITAKMNAPQPQSQSQSQPQSQVQTANATPKVAPVSQEKISVTPSVTKPKVEKQGLKTSGIKLSPIKKPAEQEQSSNTADLQIFSDAWNNLAGQFSKAPRLKTILKMNLPKYDGKVINMSVANKLQKDKLDSLKAKMLHFLMQEMKVNNLEMLITVNEALTDNRPYTTKDKYEFLANKNKNLNKLKHELDLD